MALLGLGLLAIVRTDYLAGRLDNPFWERQAVWAGVALAALVGCSLSNSRWLERWSYWIYAVALAALVAVYFFPAVHGAHRWIRVGPMGFQPSELAKLALIVALASYLSRAARLQGMRSLIVPLILTVVPLGLILREPDLGTSLVLVPVAFGMLYAAGVCRRDLLLIALCGALLGPVVWSQTSREQRSRITSLFQQTEPGQRPTADGYQLHQAKQVLALGGVGGSWLAGDAVDDLQAYHLPEAHTDFVFVMIGERFGWLGLLGTVTLFLAVVIYALQVAACAGDIYGRLVATGVAMLLASQMLINTGMTLGLLPITGITLPLVSYGGSALVTYAAALGLVAGVKSQNTADPTWLATAHGSSGALR